MRDMDLKLLEAVEEIVPTPSPTDTRRIEEEPDKPETKTTRRTKK